MVTTTENINQPAREPEPEVLPDGTVRKSSYQAATEGTAADGPAVTEEQVSVVRDIPRNTSGEEKQMQLSDIDRMRDYFATRPKVSIYIPESQDEHVIINGYAFHLKKGEQVEVPVDVADILKEAWRSRGQANVIRRIETIEY
jgi:hypothetical protein